MLTYNMEGGIMINQLIKIHDLIPDAIIQLKYLTNDNFLKEVLYDKPYDLLHVKTAQKLLIASNILKKQNYRLIIWDAYRPIEIQKKLWDIVSDERFVAPPERGSKHNFGVAVDVTLADLEGNELEMPSKFDDFSEKANAYTDQIPSEVLARLKVLQKAMIHAGFTIYKNEWWHFNDSDWG